MYKIDENELKGLIEARAILDVMRDRDYDDDFNNYLEDCIRDFGCNDMDEVVGKLIVEFGYEEL